MAEEMEERKRPMPLMVAGKDSGPSRAKRLKTNPELAEIVDLKSTSLAPTKKQNVVMNPNDPLVAKLEKLKQLLKEEGITKLHIVPKIDQFAHKTAIAVKNVYRYDHISMHSFHCPIFCELYLDNVFVAAGQPYMQRSSAMLDSYIVFTNRLCLEPIAEIAKGRKRWTHYLEEDPDLCSVVTKWQGQDNDSLFTNNLANMKQMMQSMPDVKIPIERLVYMEHDADSLGNAFKSLELSATRNLMLLECEIVRNPSETFTCIMSLQGKQLSTATAPTKNAAKRLCSESIVTRLKKKHDFITVAKEYVGKTITKDELMLVAAKKRSLGEKPMLFSHRIEPEKDTPEAVAKQADVLLHRPENAHLSELLPWTVNAMYDILDEYYKKMCLEDLMLDNKDIPKMLWEVMIVTAAKMGLRTVTRVRLGLEKALLRRTFTAHDTLKILQLKNGQSGRYTLVQCVHKMTPDEGEKFKEEMLNKFHKLVAKRELTEKEPEPEEVKNMIESQVQRKFDKCL